MSDITIPGVTSKINSDKIIEGLMKIERIPLERLEERNELSKKQKQSWMDLNRKISTVRDVSRKLYSFQNPFDDKIVDSSDNSILSATAERSAAIEKRSVKVVKTASADKFISRPLPNNEKIEAGSYTFHIGEKKIQLNFRGGTIREFSDFINSNSASRDDLKTTVINYDRNNVYFVVESRHTGSSNRLSFSDRAADFAVNSGIMSKTVSSLKEIIPSPENIRQWTVPLDSAGYRAEGGSLTLRAGKELSVTVSPPASADAAGKLILEFEARLKKLPEEVSEAPKPPTGPALPDSGKMTFEGITILNSPFEVPVPEWTPPPEPEKITDMSVFFTGSGGKTAKIGDLGDTEEIQIFKVPLSSLESPLTSLNIRNRNTHREITVSGIRIYNPEERGDMVPANPASTASDAVVEIDGIRVTRESNTVDDLIPGVKLDLKSPGEKTVDINIKPDTENIKNSVIELVGNYNNLVAELHILSRRNEDIINELNYLSDSEKESARERMGIFQGEVSITQMRDRLQRITSESYRWNDDNIYTILSQIGVSTNSGSPGTRGAANLRGYLEIDEKKLDAALEADSSKIKNLFGFDRDADMVTDSGVAFELDNYLKAYNETGGIIALKTGTIDRSIARTETEITDYNKRLARIEQDLKRKYGMMEGALQDMEKTSNALQNMNSNNNSR